MYSSPSGRNGGAGIAAGGKPGPGDGPGDGAAGAPRDATEGGHQSVSGGSSDVEPVPPSFAAVNRRGSSGSLPELNVGAHAHNPAAESEESDDEEDAGEQIASVLHQGEQSEQMRLFDLAVRMSSEVELRDHKRNLKKHKACFTGRVAVQWMLANGVARTVDDAAQMGQKLVNAGLVKAVSTHKTFLNRSFLYRFGDGMDRYVQAARWCMSQEMGKIRGEVKDVCAVVDRHTAATRAISSEHAAAMERVELVIFEMRTQLAWTRAAVFMLSFAVLALLASHVAEEDVAGFGPAWLKRTHVPVTLIAAALAFSAGVFVVDRKSFDTVLYTADDRYFEDVSDGELDDTSSDGTIDAGAGDGDGGRRSGTGNRDDFLAAPGSVNAIAGLRRRLRRRGGAANLTVDASNVFYDSRTGDDDTHTPRGPGLRSLSQREGFRDVDSPRGPRHGTSGTPSGSGRRLARLTSFHRFFGVSPRGARGSFGDGSSSEPTPRPEDQALPPPLASSTVFTDAGERTPVGVRLSPEYPRQWIPGNVKNRPEDGVTLQTQVPFEFETELFKGRAVIFLRGLDNTPDSVFKGKARAIQFSVQGRFKRPVFMDDLHFGMSLARPLRHLPTRWLLNLCTRVVRSLGAQYSMDLSDPTSARPYMLAPIALAAQTISCAAPGAEPDLTLTPIEENARMACLDGNGKEMSANERRRKLSKIIRDAKSARRKAGCGDLNPGAANDGRVPTYDTENVWTFSFWQSQIDMSKYSVDLGVGKFDLVPIMDGQPIALLCQTSDAGEIGFRFEVWHERLLQRAHAHRAPDEVVSRPPRDLKAGDDEGGRGQGLVEAPEAAS